jgi:hypothetical protein
MDVVVVAVFVRVKLNGMMQSVLGSLLETNSYSYSQADLWKRKNNKLNFV